MLTKKELARIRQRFEAGKADLPLRIEGNHIKDGGQVIGLGWHVHGTGKTGDHEYTVAYASHTTFEAATFLVHLPVDMSNMLDDLEHYHLVLAGLLAGDEEALRIAKRLVVERGEQEKKSS